MNAPTRGSGESDPLAAANISLVPLRIQLPWSEDRPTKITQASNNFPKVSYMKTSFKYSNHKAGTEGHLKFLADASVVYRSCLSNLICQDTQTSANGMNWRMAPYYLYELTEARGKFATWSLVHCPLLPWQVARSDSTPALPEDLLAAAGSVLGTRIAQCQICWIEHLVRAYFEYCHGLQIWINNTFLASRQSIHYAFTY